MGVQHISVDWMHVIVYYKLLNIEKKVCLEVETSMWPLLPKKKKSAILCQAILTQESSFAFPTKV